MTAPGAENPISWGCVSPMDTRNAGKMVNVMVGRFR